MVPPVEYDEPTCVAALISVMYGEQVAKFFRTSVGPALITLVMTYYGVGERKMPYVVKVNANLRKADISQKFLYLEKNM